jgi:pantoate--beta-alanine ligase
METVATVAALRERVRTWRAGGNRIGLVPTMGALHEGHLRLIDGARGRSDRVVASVFVNPLQFGPTEDLARYPRDLPRDQDLLQSRGVDLLFAPAAEEMYRGILTIRVDPGPLGSRWEGAVRPGHFGGVLTVVAKLLHQVGPDLAFFGQKDIQQATLIRRMVTELDWPVEVAVVGTVRESDGLALSSRNVYLSPDDRAEARVLSRALDAAHQAWAGGERSAAAIEARVRHVFLTTSRLEPDYVAVVDPDGFESVNQVGGDTIVAVAARVGPTRLIDNIILGIGLSGSSSPD